MTAYNQRIVNFYFQPQTSGTFSDSGSLSSPVIYTDLDLDFIGESFVANFDVMDDIGLPWSTISFLFFSTYDKILEIWQENKHISDDKKKAFSADCNTPLYIPKITQAEKNSISNNTANILPPWKR